MSGELVASLTVPESETTQALLQQVTPVRFNGRFLLGIRMLDSRSTLRANGVRDGDTLTLVKSKFQWDNPSLGPNAKLDKDGCTVRRRRSFCDALVIAKQSTRCFRVKVVDNSGSWSGGMELGFTVEPPEVLPRNAALLENAWVVSFIHASDSELQTACTGGRLAAKRLLEALAPGDVVTCSVLQSGAIGIDVNEGTLHELDLKCPVHNELFPVVSLYGKMQALQLLEV